MMHFKLKWLLLVQLLLNEQALSRVPPPLALRKTPLPGKATIQEEGGTAKQGQQSLLEAEPQPGLSSADKAAMVFQAEDQVQSARHMIAILGAKLKGHMQDYIHIQENVSCGELLSATTMDDPSSPVFPQELLGLSLVPVLVVAGCPKEAQSLTLRLYDLLGVADVNELLMDVEALIERRMTQPASTPTPASAASPSEKVEAERHIEAVMYNIQQLAMVGEGGVRPENSEMGNPDKVCEGWMRVNGSMLLGKAVEGATGRLEEAVRTCESLGFQCAGVTRGGLLKYQAVLKDGSRILPSESSEYESWIRQCNVEKDPSQTTGGRVKRSPLRNCINKREERVYSVVEWIPAVSTLYNLGTAVYYASVNCSETAKERAILSAVDLGTDALMAVTGGTAGVAGYALGAGVKTGVKAGIKYLLSSMKQDEDLMVNQYSWEEGVITIH